MNMFLSKCLFNVNTNEQYIFSKRWYKQTNEKTKIHSNSEQSWEDETPWKTVAMGRMVRGKRKYLRDLFKLSFTSYVICINILSSKLLWLACSVLKTKTQLNTTDNKRSRHGYANNAAEQNAFDILKWDKKTKFLCDPH